MRLACAVALLLAGAAAAAKPIPDLVAQAWCRGIIEDPGEVELREAALAELKKRAPEALAYLLTSMSGDCEDSSAPETFAATLVCAQQGTPEQLRKAIAPLLTVSSRAESSWRAQLSLSLAAQTCTDNEPLAKLLVPEFTRRLADPNSQKGAIMGLTAYGPRAAMAVPAMTKFLERAQLDGKYDQFMAAAGFFAAVGPAGAPAEETLARALAPISLSERIASATALAALGKAERNTQLMEQLLMELLAERTAQRRPDSADACIRGRKDLKSVAAALHRVGADAFTAKALMDVLPKVHCDDERVDALEAIAELGPAAVGAELPIGDVLESNSSMWTKGVAVKTLRAIGTKRERLLTLGEAIERKLHLREVSPEITRRLPPPDKRGRSERDRYLEFLTTDVQICFAEAGHPMPESWDAMVKWHGVTDDTNDQLSRTAICLANRLCGPDEATLQATIKECCALGYQATKKWPGWCSGK